MSPKSAEATKYACNTYLASQVAITNALANFAKQVGANWREMIPAMQDDPRIGGFVHPGPGFGGSCFQKDVSGLAKMMRDSGAVEDPRMLEAVLEQNEAQKLVLSPFLRKVYGETLYGKTLAVWGLSFKKDTNDVREAASLRIVPDLLARGAEVRAHDFAAREEFQRVMDTHDIDTTNLTLCDDMYEATNEADGLLIINEWFPYRQPDFGKLRQRMRQKIIFDAKDEIAYGKAKGEEDFSFYFVGRPDIVR